MKPPIFSDDFIAPYLAEFRLSGYADIEEKRALIKIWADSSKTGKLGYFKEEEIKSRFVLEIFGEVLGFNYKNSRKWFFREEVKSRIDATKPDAALGIFQVTDKGIEGDIHVVVEIKGPNTDLDKLQNRPGQKRSAVDQAFLYAAKMDGHCNWVVVSNLKEIRFYNYKTQNAYQRFLLHDLQDEEVVKHFLFLFHKDRLTNSLKSATDKLYELRARKYIGSKKAPHILDQMYQAVYKFKGLAFVDPDFLCTIKPFNILDDHVWHYKNGRMISLNQEIADFLAQLKTTSSNQLMSPTLLAELQKRGVTEAVDKLRYILDQFSNFGIVEFGAIKNLVAIQEKNARQLSSSMRSMHLYSDDDLVFVATSPEQPVACACITCSFRTFNFTAFIKKLKTAENEPVLEPLHAAYAHYQMATDNFKKAYYLFKQAEGIARQNEEKVNEYIICKINQLSLYNLIYINNDKDDQAILKDIKSIDIDRSIHTELDLYVDNDVRKYLLQIKQNTVYLKIKDRANDLIKKLKNDPANGSDLTSLIWQHILLYSYVHKTCLVFDAFTDFRTLTGDILATLIKSYQAGHLTHLSNFEIIEAILYITPQRLQNLVRHSTDFILDDEDKIKLISQAESLLMSHSKEGILGRHFKEELLPGYLTNYHFRDRFRNIFSNLFTILSKIDLPIERVKCLVRPIISFVFTEDFLAPYNLVELGIFIERYGMVFESFHLLDLLKKAVQSDTYGTNKYHGLFKSIATSYHRYYPESLVDDVGLVKRAIANSTDHQGNAHLVHLIPLFAICAPSGKNILSAELEDALTNHFDDQFYIKTLEEGIFSWDYKDFFDRYVAYVNSHKRKGFTDFDDHGHPQFDDIYLVNLISQIYVHDIPLEHPSLKLLTNLSAFETWGIAPAKFNYAEFDPQWLLMLNNDLIMDKLCRYKKIGLAMKKYLVDNYRHDLAQIYFKYFAG